MSKIFASSSAFFFLFCGLSAASTGCAVASAPDEVGASTEALTGGSGRTCGGIANLQCPADEECVGDPRFEGMPDAAGTCKTKAIKHICGGFAGLRCPTGEKCVADPAMKRFKGSPDVSGLCVPEAPKRICGGFAGLQCPAGEKCVADPAMKRFEGMPDTSGLCVPEN